MWRGPLAYGQATATRIFSRSGTGHDHSELAPRAAAEGLLDLLDAAPQHLLVQLRQLPAEGQVAAWQGLGQGGQRLQYPVRRLEGDRGPALLAQRLEEAATLARLSRQIAGEAEAVARIARDREGSGDAAGTRQRRHPVAGLPGRVHQALAGIRDGGGAGVRNQGHIALFERRQDA